MTDDTSIMSIRELIDTAFGDSNMNVVHHKLIQTILIILARQLRLLERRVEVANIPLVALSSGSSLSVSEIKIHANVPRRKKGKVLPAGDPATGGTGGSGAAGRPSVAGAVGGGARGAGGVGAAGRPSGVGVGGVSAAGRAGGVGAGTGAVRARTGLQGEGLDKVTSTSSATSYDKTSSSAAKYTTDRSTTEKSSTEKSSSGITSSATKTTTDKSSSDKTTTSKTTSDKTSSDKTSSEKTSTDKTSSDKTSSFKTSSDKSTSDKTTSDQYKSTTETTKSSSEKTSSATKSSTEPTSTDKTSTGKSKSTTEPSSTDQTTTDSSTKKSTTQSSSDKTSKSVKPLPQDYQQLLETIEQQRERELRVIHQRTDSREERLKTPTPMASMEAMEKQYEKLLIVERVPTDDVKAAERRSQAGAYGKTPRLSVVTQDEFNELSSVVRQLQEKFKIAGVPGFPQNAQLMDDLRKGASLTDAMAALQLSARLEATEKALEKMTSLVTDLASKTPGINVEELLKKIQEKESVGASEMTADFGPQTGAQSQATIKRKSSKAPSSAKETSSKSKKSVLLESTSKESLMTINTVLKLPSEIQVEPEPLPEAPQEPKEPPDTVHYEELDNALQEVYDECVKMVTTATNRSNANANDALKIAHKLEAKLDQSLNLGDRMFDLEKLVSEYADQINILDTGLSSQMTNYQEQLTQMQHDLESGLEAMAEALANTGGDTAAVAELNNHFTNLQTDIDIASTRQKELSEMQNALSLDLQGLWKQIEILRDTKSDRDEVADALRDKAGLGALNGLVSRQEFDAVRGDIEKRIGKAYDKFNNQEITWQKAIDDLIRELNEKADWLQLVTLQESINQYIEKFRDKIRAMEEVVGEPRAAAVSRKLFRDTDCLSCATPAHLEMDKTGVPPSLPALSSSRPPAEGAEAKAKPREDGDHSGVCYPGLPVPHAIDPRAHVCHRYCGGSHTLISNTLSRAPVGMIINPALRKITTAEGTDGRLYMVDEAKKPCIPCNYKNIPAPEPSEAEPAPYQDDFVSDMVSLEFRKTSMQAGGMSDMVSVTPPPPTDGMFED